MEFFNRYKKALLVFVFVLIIVIVGYLLYAVFFKTGEEARPGAVGPATTTPGGLPIAPSGKGQVVTPGEPGGLAGEGSAGGTAASDLAKGGLTKTTPLTEASTLGAVLSANGFDLQYYNKTDGKFYRVDKNGEITALSDEVFHQAEKITWSGDRNKAILEYPDGANIVYDFSAKRRVTLPTHWQNFSFSPDSKQIVLKSLGQDPSNRWLAIASDDGSRIRGIEQIGNNDSSVYPAWSPNGQVIAVYTEGAGFDRQEVFFVGLNNENFKSTVVEGRGFVPEWSPAGDRLLYSVYSSATNLKPNLWIVDAQGDNIGNNRRNLGLETWANKCSFASDAALYCAVPQNLAEGAGLLPELAENTADLLYRVDLTTGLKKLIAIPSGNYTISDIMVSGDNRYLYFTDQASGRINKIKLE